MSGKGRRSLSKQLEEAEEEGANEARNGGKKREKKRKVLQPSSPAQAPLTQRQVSERAARGVAEGSATKGEAVKARAGFFKRPTKRAIGKSNAAPAAGDEEELSFIVEDEEDDDEMMNQRDEEDDIEEEEEDEDEGSDLPPGPKKRVLKKRKGAARKKRSLQHVLWVTVDAEKKLVKCRLCGQQQKFHLSNLKQHWTNSHAREFATTSEANERGDDVEATLKTILETKKQEGVVGYFRNSPAAVASSGGSKATISGKVRKELALLYHMICTKQSFNSTADPSFVVLKKEWGVQLDETSKILELMEPMFITAVCMKEKELMDCGAVSTTIDFWTSAAKRKYLAITYHGITADWQMSHHLLDLVHFPGSTFAELIAFCIEERIQQHLPGNTMSVATVSDRGGDVKKARNLEIAEDGEDCMNHRLNSVLNDVFGDSSKAREHKGLLCVVMIRAVSHLITMIESDRNCKLLLQLLQEKEGYDDVLQFVTKNDTRWEGLQMMLERFLRLRKALMSDFEGAEEMRRHLLDSWPAELRDANDIFQNRFFTRLQGVVACLKPFSVASKAFQDLKRPTASRVPGLLHYIDETLLNMSLSSETRGISELADALRGALAERTSEYFTGVNNCLKAALVDPSQSRLLSSFGVEDSIIDECWAKIVDECVDFHSGLDDLPPGVDIKTSCESDVDNLRNYLAESTLEKDDDPLEYYRSHTGVTKWCHKALPVVRMLLAIPAGESHCERAFSWAHGFVTRLRTRTSNRVLEMQMVLYDLFKRPGFNWETFLLQMVALGVLKKE